MDVPDQSFTASSSLDGSSPELARLVDFSIFARSYIQNEGKQILLLSTLYSNY